MRELEEPRVLHQSLDSWFQDASKLFTPTKVETGSAKGSQDTLRTAEWSPPAKACEATLLSHGFRPA